MNATRTQLMTTLEQTHAKLANLTSELTDAALDFRQDAQDWSIREILAHLVDDEMFVMRTRLERMMKEDTPSLPSHDEKKWYSQRNTSRDALTELLSDFAQPGHPGAFARERMGAHRLSPRIWAFYRARLGGFVG